jgi:hypothetical protein
MTRRKAQVDLDGRTYPFLTGLKGRAQALCYYLLPVLNVVAEAKISQ